MKVPPDVEKVVDKLIDAGHDAYVVGGSVRDALRGVDPHDWDVTTNAKPEEIQKVFRRSLYNNRFGTVAVRMGDHDVEVTTYRVEADYTDHRRPDTVAFTASLEEDLARRDFTMNAMAFRPARGGKPAELIDPFGGQRDLEARLLRAVGDPDERFREDALRMLRAVRFATLLDLRIDEPTAAATRRNAALTAGLSVLRAAPAARAAAQAEPSAQPTFSTPADAVQALVSAAKTGSPREVSTLFGPEGTQLLSGDRLTDVPIEKKSGEVYELVDEIAAMARAVRDGSAPACSAR